MKPTYRPIEQTKTHPSGGTFSFYGIEAVFPDGHTKISDDYSFPTEAEAQAQADRMNRR